MRLLISAATAVTILGVAVLLLLTPLWTHIAVRGTSAVSFATPDQAVGLSDETVAKLVLGGDFQSVGGGSFYTAAEASHLRDAQLLLYVFLALVLVAAVFLVSRLWRSRDAAEWSAVRRGGLGLVVGIVVVGVVGFMAFDLAFETFHRVFFPGGNWQFPTDSNMIRLYPYGFWQWTAVCLGVLAALGGGAVWWLARRQQRRLAA